MSDLNCNLLSEVVSNNSSHLLNIIDIYGLTQLITEPTRVTPYSSTLIDLCLTNSPDKISKSGVINIGISDHSAVYLKRKVAHLRSNMHKTVEVRQLKNFNEAEFLRDLGMIDWNRPAISISEWKWFIKQRPVWFPHATQHSYCLFGDKR